MIVVTFPLGRIIVTANALSRLTQVDILTALRRHAASDWGDLDEEDRNENTFSLENGLRLFSVYHAVSGTKFWIITESDRSCTTVLLPEDY